MTTDSFVRELNEICRRAGVPELGPSLQSAVRPAVILTPDWAGQPIVGRSKFGGVPDVPRDFIWPMSGDSPLDFLAQIRLRDLAEGLANESLLAYGMLYFFASIAEVNSGHTLIPQTYYAVHYSTLDSELQPAEVPALETPEEQAVPEIGLRSAVIAQPPVGHEDLRLIGGQVEALSPAFWDDYGEFTFQLRARAFSETSTPGKGVASEILDEDDDGELDSKARATLGEYRGHIAEEDRRKECSWTENLHQLLGFGAQLTPRRLYLEQARQGGAERSLRLESPAAARLAEGARDWRLLFQFDSDRDLGLAWGNEEFLQFWIREEDLACQRFDQVRLTMGQ